MSGGVRRVWAHDNLMGTPGGAGDGPTVTGLLIKTNRGRGGVVEDILFERITMLNVSQCYSWIPALTVDMQYKPDKPPDNATATPLIQNVTFRDIAIDYAQQLGCLAGLPERPLGRGIFFHNITVGGFGTNWSCNQFVTGNPAICDSRARATPCRYRI